MGNEKMAMMITPKLAKATCALLFLAVTVIDCAPFDSSNLAQELSEMIPAVAEAVKPLKTMLQDEQSEVNEMADVKQTIDGFPAKQMKAETASQEQELLVTASQRIELDTIKATRNEELQQAEAMKTLGKVNGWIDSYEARVNPVDSEASNEEPGVNNKQHLLGEGNGDTRDTPMGAIQHALEELREVSATLTADTSSMNTKAKIDAMHNEAADLEMQSSTATADAGQAVMQHDPNGPGPPMLGEAGAGSDLQGAVNQQTEEIDARRRQTDLDNDKQMHPSASEDKQMMAMEIDAQGDPMGMDPQMQMDAKGTAAEGNIAEVMQKEQHEVTDLYKAEAAIEESERNNEGEVQSLIKKLS